VLEVGIALTGLAKGDVVLDQKDSQRIVASRKGLEEFSFGIHVNGVAYFGTAKGHPGLDIGRDGANNGVDGGGPSRRTLEEISTGNISGDAGYAVLAGHQAAFGDGEGIVKTDFDAAEFGTVGGTQVVKSGNTVGTAGSTPVTAKVDGKSILNAGYNQTGSAGSAAAGSAAPLPVRAGSVRNPGIVLFAGNGHCEAEQGDPNFVHGLVD